MLLSYEELSKETLPFTKNEYEEITTLIKTLKANNSSASNDKFITWVNVETFGIMIEHKESKRMFELN